MLEAQPQERGTPPNTLRAHRKPVGSSPPFEPRTESRTNAAYSTSTFCA